MEGPSSNINLSNAHGKNLEFLLEAFGSMISPDDMASAYCQAGYDIQKASEILYSMLGSSSNQSTNNLTTEPSSSVTRGGNVYGANHRPRTLTDDPAMIPTRSKPRTSGVSVGSVSGIIGADYGRFKAKNKESYESTKPVKLMSDEFPVSQIWDEKPQAANRAPTEKMNKDTETFLLQMLGDGFQLDINVMREVIGGCGYDVQESMEKLMNMSAPTLNVGDATSNIADQTPPDTNQDLNIKFEEKLQINNSCTRSKSNLEQEILANLFNSERSEADPGSILPKIQPRTRKYGVVTGPLEDTVVEFTTPIVKKEINGDGKEVEDNYDTLREAVMEHWTTMKRYYRAAADAYAKGNYELSGKLVEQGHFYMAKAREADEKSTKILTQSRDDGEVISLNLTDYDRKDALCLLKVQLKSICGIPSIRYLKVVVGANDDNKRPNARKRLISRLLVREEIAWTEEQDGEVMVIRIDVIKPTRLSFNK